MAARRSSTSTAKADTPTGATSENPNPTEAEQADAPTSGENPPKGTTTLLDSDTTKPSTTVPGDGPADTTDPTEIATSVTPQPGEEAIATGTVQAVTKVTPPAKPKTDKAKARTETYTAIKADGTEVTVVRDLDTGVSVVK